MVFTLQRYIFRELFRVFLLASLALTLMLSLGSILRPVQEYGVGPGHVIHLLGYFLPITLTFVLPMAALFAASLVYGRFASDNELDACRASGISLLTLVYPGLALAIMVAIANLILSFHVMPAFVQRAEKSLKADAKQIIFRNIQRKGYYRASDGQYLIYADYADAESETLAGVVITEVKDGAIKKIISAETAQVNFNPHKRFNEVQITAFKTNQIGTDEDGWFSVEKMSVAQEFPSMMGDNIKFKKIDRIKQIAANPILFAPVEKLARQAYAQFTAELLAQDIVATIGAAGKDGQAVSNPDGQFYKLYSGTKVIDFTTDHCAAGADKQVLLSGNVTVVEYDSDSGDFLRTLRCSRAALLIEGDELAPTLTLEMYTPRWQRPDGSQGLAAGRPRIRGLILPKTVTNYFKTDDILEAIHPETVSASLKAGPSGKLRAMQNSLAARIRKTLIEIKAEIHSRLVFGIGCVPLILIGIGLGIIQKGGHLLSAFGASSIPAAALIVFIMMGKNITKNQGAQVGSGVLLMWTGLILLSVLTVLLYRKLLKN